MRLTFTAYSSLQEAMEERNSQLFMAVESNNIDKATLLLDRGADVNSVGGEFKQNVLALACWKGYKELAGVLVSRGAYVNVGHDWFTIPLHAAAFKGHEEIVDFLFKKDADLHKQDMYGETAVHCAAIPHHPSVLKRFVSCGANVDIDNNEGKTPLWYASAAGHVHCVDVLLSVGANPHHKSKKNESPLDIAKKLGRTTIIKILEDVVIPSQASEQSISQSNVQPSPAPSTLATQSVKCEQRGQSHEPASPAHSQSHESASPVHSQSHEPASFARSQSHEPASPARSQSYEPASPAHSQSFSPADNVSLTSLMSFDGTGSLLQGTATSNTANNKDVLKQLIDEIDHSKQETETCKKQIVEILNDKTNELEDAAGKRKALETEIAEIRSRKEVLQRSLIEEQKEKNCVVQEKAALQLTLFDEQEEEEQNENRVEELEELLSTTEKANDRAREMLRESEKALSIPSRDIQLTDKNLGKGSYGKVYIAYWNGCPVAVKMLYENLAANKDHIDVLQQEVSISWKIHHPNIAAVCGVTIELEDEKKTAWIIMELLQGSMAVVINETQRRGVRPLTLREKIDLTCDSLCGLEHLHTLPRFVLHGDIRPTNILVTIVMRAKLGDLGAACFSDASHTTGMMSPDYTAPERLDKNMARKSKETDVYSMGVSVCQLFTGQTPSPRKRMDQIQRIQQRNVRLLCNRMVADEPDRRPSAGDGLTAIGRIRETDDYNGCPPRRMVKGKLDGVQHVALTDQMW